LFENGIGHVARDNFFINGKSMMIHWAFPDVVIAFTVPDDPAPSGLESSDEFWREVATHQAV
jgi:hypothetical protein